jgi:hypothetical protein
MAIWSSFWSFDTFFQVLVCCTKKKSGNPERDTKISEIETEALINCVPKTGAFWFRVLNAYFYSQTRQTTRSSDYRAVALTNRSNYHLIIVNVMKAKLQT